MDGNTKDGRHPHLECPVHGFLSASIFPQTSFIPLRLLKPNFREFILFPEQFEVILGLGLPIFRARRFSVNRLITLKQVFAEEEIISEKMLSRVNGEEE